MKEELSLVLVWLKAGAIYSDGVLLFKRIFGDDHPFMIVLRSKSPANHLVLKQALRSYLRRNRHLLPASQEASPAETKPDNTQVSKVKLREDFAFLSEPGCPPELKILAAEKITAYHNYCKAHAQMFEALTAEQGFQAAKDTVENFIENRRILKELEYYKTHHKILGEHPIFKHYKIVQALRTKSVLELTQLKKRLEHNIWRIRSEISKGDKPHLAPERERAIREKTEELAEIDRLLEKYA